MTDATIIFTRSRGLFSAIVRWATRSLASHVGVGFVVDGVPVVVHAYGVGGVQIVRRRAFYAGRIPVAEFLVAEPVSLHRLIADVGDRYDYESVAAHVPALVARWFGRRWRKPWTSDNAILCSELVAKLPIAAFKGLDPEAVTPQDLLARCLVALPAVI